jgi:hypothetical protein
MPDPFYRCSIPTQNRHDAFSELMAISIVPELIYFYIPLEMNDTGKGSGALTS